MHVFARSPFRYQGIDYPYGNFDVPDEVLAAGMVTAGLVIDTSIPGTGGAVNLAGSGVTGQLPLSKVAISGTPDGTKVLRDDGTWAPVTGTGTVTNAGGALTSNALVLGNGGADTKVAPGLRSDGTGALTVGLAGTTAGNIVFENATSGSVTLTVPTGGLGTRNVKIPAVNDTLAALDATQVFTNKTISGANNTLTVRLANDVTGLLPLANMGFTGTPNGSKFLRDDGSWQTLTQSFTTTLLNAVTVAGAGPSFTYPGGSSNFSVTCSNWNGAIVTLRRSTDGGSTWSPLSGDYGAFSANTNSVINNEVTGVLIDCLVTGTPGAALTATLSR